MVNRAQSSTRFDARLSIEALASVDALVPVPVVLDLVPLAGSGPEYMSSDSLGGSTRTIEPYGESEKAFPRSCPTAPESLLSAESAHSRPLELRRVHYLRPSRGGFPPPRQVDSVRTD
jgi:hypothetical protein